MGSETWNGSRLADEEMIIFRGWIPCFDSVGCVTEEHLASKNLLLLSQNILVWKIWHNLKYCTKEGQLNKRQLCGGGSSMP